MFSYVFVQVRVVITNNIFGKYVNKYIIILLSIKLCKNFKLI